MKATSRRSSSILAACALALAACGDDPAEPVNPPAAPTGLTATPFNGAVALSWDAAAGAASYDVYQAATAGLELAAMTRVGPGIGGTAFNAAAPNDVARYYRVTAVNSGGASPGSEEISATASSTALPATPVGLTAAAGNGSVTLDWDDVPGATSYRVYWSNWPGVGTTGGYFTITGATTFTHGSLTNGTTYYYVVVAAIGATLSGVSDEVSATPATLPYIEASAVLAPPTFGFGAYQVQVCTSSSCSTPIANATVKLGGTTLVFDTYDTYEGEPSGSIAGATLQLVVTIPSGSGVASGTYRASATMYTQAPTLTSPTSGAAWSANQSHAFTWTHAAPTTSSMYTLAAINQNNVMASVFGAALTTQNSYTFAANTLTPGAHLGFVAIGPTGPVAIPGTQAGSSFIVAATSNFVSFTVQ